MGLIGIVSAGLGDESDAASTEETSKEDGAWFYFGLEVIVVVVRTDAGYPELLCEFEDIRLLLQMIRKGGMRGQLTLRICL